MDGPFVFLGTFLLYVNLQRQERFLGMVNKMGPDKRKSNANRQIQENLRRVYEEALSEEIPSEFIEMINRLKKEKEARSDGK
jgi:hypothetical protein